MIATTPESAKSLKWKLWFCGRHLITSRLKKVARIPPPHHCDGGRVKIVLACCPVSLFIYLALFCCSHPDSPSSSCWILDFSLLSFSNLALNQSFTLLVILCLQLFFYSCLVCVFYFPFDGLDVVFKVVFVVLYIPQVFVFVRVFQVHVPYGEFRVVFASAYFHYIAFFFPECDVVFSGYRICYFEHKLEFF